METTICWTRKQAASTAIGYTLMSTAAHDCDRELIDGLFALPTEIIAQVIRHLSNYELNDFLSIPIVRTRLGPSICLVTLAKSTALKNICCYNVEDRIALSSRSRSRHADEEEQELTAKLRQMMRVVVEIPKYAFQGEDYMTALQKTVFSLSNSRLTLIQTDENFTRKDGLNAEAFQHLMTGRYGVLQLDSFGINFEIGCTSLFHSDHIQLSPAIEGLHADHFWDCVFKGSGVDLAPHVKHMHLLGMKGNHKCLLYSYYNHLKELSLSNLSGPINDVKLPTLERCELMGLPLQQVRNWRCENLKTLSLRSFSLIASSMVLADLSLPLLEELKITCRSDRLSLLDVTLPSLARFHLQTNAVDPIERFERISLPVLSDLEISSGGLTHEPVSITDYDSLDLTCFSESNSQIRVKLDGAPIILDNLCPDKVFSLNLHCIEPVSLEKDYGFSLLRELKLDISNSTVNDLDLVNFSFKTCDVLNSLTVIGCTRTPDLTKLNTTFPNLTKLVISAEDIDIHGLSHEQLSYLRLKRTTPGPLTLRNIHLPRLDDFGYDGRAGVPNQIKTRSILELDTPMLKSFSLTSKGTPITTVDGLNAPTLEILFIGGAQLPALDTSRFSKLKRLVVCDCGITDLTIGSKRLLSLNVSQNVGLKSIASPPLRELKSLACSNVPGMRNITLDTPLLAKRESSESMNVAGEMVPLYKYVSTKRKVKKTTKKRKVGP